MSEDLEPVEKVKNPCQTFYLHSSSGEINRYYPKSEADKLIAEKDAEIAQLQAMLEERNKQVGELKEERRWRKASEELPTDGEAVAVCFHTEEGKLVTSVDCFFDEEWQMMDDCEGYWMPLPKAPEEAK